MGHLRNAGRSSRQIELFRDVGIEYFIVSLEPDHEVEELELFGREVVPNL